MTLRAEQRNNCAMSNCEFRFHGHALVARPSGALFWPAEGALVVADLHLGKSERMARRGGALLPPFETFATLERLDAELSAVQAQGLILLGDSFDDDRAHLGAAQPLLDAICARIETVWITGNHDPARAALPGRVISALAIGGVTLRHIAGQEPDISGHYHPKFRISGQRRPAFLLGPAHLILPAFGTYTGGLDHDADPLAALVPQGCAILTGTRARMVPIDHTRRRPL